MGLLVSILKRINTRSWHNLAISVLLLVLSFSSFAFEWHIIESIGNDARSIRIFRLPHKKLKVGQRGSLSNKKASILAEVYRIEEEVILLRTIDAEAIPFIAGDNVEWNTQTFLKSNFSNKKPGRKKKYRIRKFSTTRESIILPIGKDDGGIQKHSKALISSATASVKAYATVVTDKYSVWKSEDETPFPFSPTEFVTFDTYRESLSYTLNPKSKSNRVVKLEKRKKPLFKINRPLKMRFNLNYTGGETPDEAQYGRDPQLLGLASQLDAYLIKMLSKKTFLSAGVRFSDYVIEKSDITFASNSTQLMVEIGFYVFRDYFETFRPYITFGAGWGSSISDSITQSSHEGNVITFPSAEIGLEYPITTKISIVGEAGIEQYSIKESFSDSTIGETDSDVEVTLYNSYTSIGMLYQF